MLQKIMENSISYCIMRTLYNQCLVHKTSSKGLLMAKYNVSICSWLQCTLSYMKNNHNRLMI